MGNSFVVDRVRNNLPPDEALIYIGAGLEWLVDHFGIQPGPQRDARVRRFFQDLRAYVRMGPTVRASQKMIETATAEVQRGLCLIGQSWEDLGFLEESYADGAGI